MNPIYSIIVPVYNAELYLEECVRSVLLQNQCGAFELILVNDGSKDGSGVLCDSLAQQDARIHVIHQKNQGVSAARNAGIDAAKGQYLLFLDSDDLWKDGLLEALENKLQQEPDMIVFGYRQFDDDTALEEFVPEENKHCETGKDYFQRYEKMRIMPAVSCWCTAFRHAFLKENGIRFPMRVQYGEDFRFYMDCLNAAQKLVCISQVFYKYRVNEASATHTLSLPKVRDLLTACADMYRMIPCAILANYYCTNILHLAGLSRRDALQLRPLLRQNRDIQRAATGRKQRSACMLYNLLGWYGAAKAVQFGLDLRYGRK